jgi:hypothetical protein
VEKSLMPNSHKIRWTTAAAALLLVFLMSLPVLLTVQSSAWGIRPDAVDALSKWYGAVAAILSALALLGVAASVYYQASQTKVNQVLALRTMQKELMQIAMADPQTYSICFGSRQTNEGFLEFQRRAFITLRLRHATDLLAMGAISEQELHTEIVTSILATSVGRRYWETVRPYWRGSGRPAQRRVVQLMEEEYGRAESAVRGATSPPASDDMRAALAAAGHREFPYDPAGAARRLAERRISPEVREAAIRRLAEGTNRPMDEIRAELDRRDER